MLGVETHDTFHRESASAPVVGDFSLGWSELESVGDSSSLLAGMGMDMLDSVQICGLPCSWIRLFPYMFWAVLALGFLLM